MDTLLQFGWTDAQDDAWKMVFGAGLQPGRVVADFGTTLKVAIPEIVVAELTGKLAHYSQREAVPKVGDWVGVRISENGHAVIECVLPRRSEIARKVNGKRSVKQILAVNVDIAFVLLALDNDFNVARLQRFLYQLSAACVAPVIVLNKADKTDDLKGYVDQLQSFNLPIVTCIATTGVGVNELLQLIKPGHTAMLLGSSGVGKSTLTNQLLGRDIQPTQEIRESDSTGRHTTVHRELFILPNGGLLIDTPGIRELQLWGTEDELDENFDDITELALHCKYTSCQHGNEPDCAIRSALSDGSLDPRHYANYEKMKKELLILKEKNTVKAKQKSAALKRKASRQAQDDMW